jgi:hypothetical protein
VPVEFATASAVDAPVALAPELPAATPVDEKTPPELRSVVGSLRMTSAGEAGPA